MPPTIMIMLPRRIGISRAPGNPKPNHTSQTSKNQHTPDQPALTIRTAVHNQNSSLSYDRYSQPSWQTRGGISNEIRLTKISCSYDRGYGALGEEEVRRGALPPRPPLRARPLEPASFRQEEGAAAEFEPVWAVSPSSCLKLMDFKGSAFNGVEGQSPRLASSPPSAPAPRSQQPGVLRNGGVGRHGVWGWV